MVQLVHHQFSLLLEISALLLPGEEAPQVRVGVLQQVRHAVCLLPRPSLSHVLPEQRLDRHGVGERVTLQNRTLAVNIAMSITLFIVSWTFMHLVYFSLST